MKRRFMLVLLALMAAPLAPLSASAAPLQRERAQLSVQLRDGHRVEVLTRQHVETQTFSGFDITGAPQHVGDGARRARHEVDVAALVRAVVSDPQRAQRESPYGTTIAHGFLSLSLLSFFVGQVVQVGGARMAINYGLNRVRFPAPLPVGARIRARCALQALEDIESGVQATFYIVIEVEGGSKPCCVAEWVARYYQ